MLLIYAVINAVANSLSEQTQQSEQPALQLQPERLLAEQFMQSNHASPNLAHSSGAVSNCLSNLPAVEHALAYEVLSNGVSASIFLSTTKTSRIFNLVVVVWYAR